MEARSTTVTPSEEKEAEKPRSEEKQTEPSQKEPICSSTPMTGMITGQVGVSTMSPTPPSVSHIQFRSSLIQRKLLFKDEDITEEECCDMSYVEGESIEQPKVSREEVTTETTEPTSSEQVRLSLKRELSPFSSSRSMRIVKKKLKKSIRSDILDSTESVLSEEEDE